MPLPLLRSCTLSQPRLPPRALSCGACRRAALPRRGVCPSRGQAAGGGRGFHRCPLRLLVRLLCLLRLLGSCCVSCRAVPPAAAFAAPSRLLRLTTHRFVSLPSRPPRHQGRHLGARLLHGRAAGGDGDGWQDRGAGGGAHHQASCCCRHPVLSLLLAACGSRGSARGCADCSWWGEPRSSARPLAASLPPAVRALQGAGGGGAGLRAGRAGGPDRARV